jgi:hypothetical protein
MRAHPLPRARNSSVFVATESRRHFSFGVLA